MTLSNPNNVHDAARRVDAWLDSNWKYVSDELTADLRALTKAALEPLSRPGSDGGV